MKEISVVIPVYRAEKIINELCSRLIKNLSLITDNFEIILVDDGSPDKSWNKITKNANDEKRIKGYQLSRNFGQHHAITAGLEAAKGEWIVVMDCDLQDRPEEIPKLYTKAQEGYDLVVAQRIVRQDVFLKRMSSKMFYKLFSYLTDTKQDSSIANFGIYKRKVIQAVLSMKECVRAFPILVQWVGFKRYEMPVMHAERVEGESSYTFFTLLKLATGIIIAFSQRPLKLTLKLGLLIMLGAILLGVYYLRLYWLDKITVPGYASIILSIWFLSGAIIALIGMVGIYIGKTFEQVKQRPLYIINESVNSHE
jgi:glycosyltransferase involved in cell wall biosynthesis